MILLVYYDLHLTFSHTLSSDLFDKVFGFTVILAEPRCIQNHGANMISQISPNSLQIQTCTRAINKVTLISILRWCLLLVRKHISRFYLDINCIDWKRGCPLKRVWKQCSCKEILGRDHLLRIVKLTCITSNTWNNLVIQSVALCSINVYR